MSSPTDFRPVIDMLFEAWKYRRAAIEAGDMASWAKWDEAIDALLERWVKERPELGWQGDPLG